ncbi:hypothetical protein JTB14_018938 [Gonioctena quinquepunctata]|nr:hypothetical protein JTB14_018938 [Gonioctena quinquepunctata]
MQCESYEVKDDVTRPSDLLLQFFKERCMLIWEEPGFSLRRHLTVMRVGEDLANLNCGREEGSSHFLGVCSRLRQYSPEKGFVFPAKEGHLELHGGSRLVMKGTER